jgi:putative addiction module killer protein
MNQHIEIRVYETETGKEPYNIWFDKLDTTTQVVIDARLERVKIGNFGNCKPLKGGLWEFIIDYGPGYRIYFGEINNKIILLLSAGNKRNQSRDIDKAREYWLDYMEKS